MFQMFEVPESLDRIPTPGATHQTPMYIQLIRGPGLVRNSKVTTTRPKPVDLQSLTKKKDLPSIIRAFGFLRLGHTIGKLTCLHNNV